MLANYEEYAKESLKGFSSRERERRLSLFNAVNDRKMSRVLDLGCGAGHELLPFLEETDAFCIGVDSGDRLGDMTRPIFADFEKAAFVRSSGNELPFDDDTFDVIICRVALPYMDNRLAIAEMSRILKPGGALILKTHAPSFYLWLLYDRAKTFSPRQIAYPLICLAGSLWHTLTKRQLQTGFWRGKEIFQTDRFLRREFARYGVSLDKELPDSNRITPSRLYVKESIAKGLMLVHCLGELFAAL